ncbi:hypothetical protein [Comamonas jiangduensis]|uniref:hypothetical protein n=1 Tax=Comamonas jiangduensis TaxID=1194168 RepID=UPI003BF80D82
MSVHAKAHWQAHSNSGAILEAKKNLKLRIDANFFSFLMLFARNCGFCVVAKREQNHSEKFLAMLASGLLGVCQQSLGAGIKLTSP